MGFCRGERLHVMAARVRTGRAKNERLALRWRATPPPPTSYETTAVKECGGHTNSETETVAAGAAIGHLEVRPVGRR